MIVSFYNNLNTIISDNEQFEFGRQRVIRLCDTNLRIESIREVLADLRWSFGSQHGALEWNLERVWIGCPKEEVS